MGTYVDQLNLNLLHIIISKLDLASLDNFEMLLPPEVELNVWVLFKYKFPYLYESFNLRGKLIIKFLNLEIPNFLWNYPGYRDWLSISTRNSIVRAYINGGVSWDLTTFEFYSKVVTYVRGNDFNYIFYLFVDMIIKDPNYQRINNKLLSVGIPVSYTHLTLPTTPYV